MCSETAHSNVLARRQRNKFWKLKGSSTLLNQLTHVQSKSMKKNKQQNKTKHMFLYLNWIEEKRNRSSYCSWFGEFFDKRSLLELATLLFSLQIRKRYTNLLICRQWITVNGIASCVCCPYVSASRGTVNQSQICSRLKIVMHLFGKWCESASKSLVEPLIYMRVLLRHTHTHTIHDKVNIQVTIKI